MQATPFCLKKVVCERMTTPPTPPSLISSLFMCLSAQTCLFECRWHKKTFIATKYICFSICCYWSVAFDACIDSKITDPQWEISIMTCMGVTGSIFCAFPSMSLLTGWPCVLLSSVYVLMSLSLNVDCSICLMSCRCCCFLYFCTVIYETHLNQWEFHKKG